MTLGSSIIQQAFRESNIIAVGKSPKEPDAAEALVRLQNIVAAAYGFEVGEQFTDWPIGLEGVNLSSEYNCWSSEIWQYPRINVRMIAASDEPQTVYLPARPYDGSRVALIDPASRLAAAPMTIDGNGRQVEGVSVFTADTDGLTKLWFYRADLGGWVAITPLIAENEFPFPAEFDDYFITKLAMRINPRYGRSMPQESVASLEEMLSKLRARYKQSEIVGVDAALTRTSEMYNSGDSRLGYSAPVIGDRGWMY